MNFGQFIGWLIPWTCSPKLMTQRPKRTLWALHLVFFCSCFYSLKNPSEANTVSREIYFTPAWTRPQRSLHLSASHWCDYIQGSEIEVLGQNDSSDLWRCILEHEEPCPKCACTSLWTVPGPMFHQVNPMLRTFWNTVPILYLKMHGQNFPYLSLIRSNYKKQKQTNKQKNHPNYIGGSV